MRFFESTLSNYRDKKYFKGSDIKYPDLIFAKTKNFDSVINFYKKIVNIFNKLFNRNVTVNYEIDGDNFKIYVTYENGLKPKYYSYPNDSGHIVIDYIDKYTPATSLRHELIHEMLVPFILNKFELINSMDLSSELSDIDNVQRNRVNYYTLEDIFYERVVENIERLPDFKDTFPIGYFIKDVNNRILKDFSGNVETTLKKIFTDDNIQNNFLKESLLKTYKNIITKEDLIKNKEYLEEIFSKIFNISKNVIEKELQYKINKFQEYFNNEYYGFLKKNKINMNESIMLKNKYDEFVYGCVVAEEYDKLPLKNQVDFDYWNWLILSNDTLFKRITGKIDVEFVDDDPYKNHSEIVNDIKNNRRLKIWKGASDLHPIFSPIQNWVFRTVHDYFHDIGEFNLRGEYKVYNRQIRLAKKQAVPALFSEIIGQVSYAVITDKFPEQKVSKMYGFDYFNVGLYTDNNLKERHKELLDSLINKNEIFLNIKGNESINFYNKFKELYL
jgi:hypothetical protein